MGLEALTGLLGGGAGLSTSSSASGSQSNDFYNLSGINFGSGSTGGVDTTGSKADSSSSSTPRQTAGGFSPQNTSSDFAYDTPAGNSSLLWLGIGLGVL